MRKTLALVIALGLLLSGLVQAEGLEQDPYPGKMPEPGFLGLSSRWSPKGAEILILQTDTPADLAGLRVRDVIVGQADPLTPTLKEPFFPHPAGTRRVLHVLRGGDSMTFQVVWAPVTPQRREWLVGRASAFQEVSGRVEVVSGRRAGILLSAPVAWFHQLPGSKAQLLRNQEPIAVPLFVQPHDDWRVVVEVPDGAPAPQVGDVGSFSWKQASVAGSWGPNWTPGPREEERRPAPTRKFRVPRALLDEHIRRLEAHYRTMLVAVPPAYQGFCRNVLLAVDDSSGLNASAGVRQGRRIITVTRGMCELVLILSYVAVTARERTLEGTLQEIQELALVPAACSDQFPVLRGFSSRMRTPAFRQELERMAAPMYTFLLGHELGHHLLAHNRQDDTLLGRLASREQEQGADSMGALFVQATKGDPHSVFLFTEFLALVEVYKGPDGDTWVPDYLQTHPDWSARTAYLKGVFSVLPATR